VIFDDFQISRAEQQAQVDSEKAAWREREQRLEREKPALLRFAAPRLKSLRDEMIGVQSKFFRRHVEEPSPAATDPPKKPPENGVYFADHERAGVRVTRTNNHPTDQNLPKPSSPQPATHLEETDLESEPRGDFIESMLADEFFEDQENATDIEVEDENESEFEESEEESEEENEFEDANDLEDEQAEEFEDEQAEEFEDEQAEEFEDEESDDYEEEAGIKNIPGSGSELLPPTYAPQHKEPAFEALPLDARLEPTLMAYLDALRAFDSFPRRANELRDPRADFVALLAELLDILREELAASSAMFFWVNTKKQQLVLESAALDDRAYQFLASGKRFPIELDAVSRVVTKRRPELHSSINPQAELDLIPYYRDAIGTASFAGMPVLFGDGLVAVLTVDSLEPDHFTQETLRILTSYSKLISGLIRSYIEKYDLLAAARTLDAARKLHEMVSPDASLRVLRDQRKNPEYVLRALTEAAGEIIDWDWLATASFDDQRRLWNVSSLQSKRTGAYVPPQTPISMDESIVSKCLSTGRSMRIDNLGPQHVRFNVEEDSAIGHSFLVIPIRTSTKNYGALAIEHSEKARFTDADVETLEHLARSAAAALEIIVLGEMVGERALTDLLTGALNKHGLVDRANQELARAMKFDEPLTFVLFEIDGASEFRSRFSQEDSDTIVLAITRLLKFGVRPFDVIARIGEHSFAAILVKMSDEEGYLWSEKMRKMIVSEVIAIGKRSYSVTVSIGVSGARRDGRVQELIEGAELALERARELGGNNVIVY
jgi:diguanylate cyclase (GGDEF)-like protein